MHFTILLSQTPSKATQVLSPQRISRRTNNQACGSCRIPDSGAKEESASKLRSSSFFRFVKKKVRLVRGLIRDVGLDEVHERSKRRS
jgi:hypothetical protein